MKKLITFISLSLLSLSLAGEEIIKDAEGMDCHIYTPSNVSTTKTYQLVVGVHGNNGKGKGAGGYQGWTEEFDCIVIGPSFKSGYQGARPSDVSKLLKLVKVVGAKYKINDKIFLAGHSAGAQFAHRFAMRDPNKLCACVATSAGSWATGEGIFGSISNSAKTINM